MKWICALLGLSAAAIAQTAQPPSSPQDSGLPQLPFRFEAGGYDSHVTNGYGNWGGAQTQFWVRSNPIFIPAFFFDSQTRPTGTQQNYAFFSYLNWSKSFYTTQGFSVAPQHDQAAIYFPKYRYDVKANLKVGPSRSVVVGV